MVQDVKLLVEDIGTLKPTILCAVPRVLDRIFSGKGLLESPNISILTFLSNIKIRLQRASTFPAERL